jgi:ERCC4-type nuclease
VREFVLLVDEREKRPLPIPEFITMWDPSTSWERPSTHRVRIHKVSAHLKTADYAVERKGSLTELHSNLLTSTGRRRFVAELKRLRSETEHPLLLLEGSPHTLKAVSHPVNPDIVRDQLLTVLHEYGIAFHMIPTESPTARRAAGEWLVATLIAHALTNRIPLETDNANAEVPDISSTSG